MLDLKKPKPPTTKLHEESKQNFIKFAQREKHPLRVENLSTSAWYSLALSAFMLPKIFGESEDGLTITVYPTISIVSGNFLKNLNT